MKRSEGEGECEDKCCAKDKMKRNLNIIINKSVLFNSYAKEEIEKRSMQEQCSSVKEKNEESEIANENENENSSHWPIQGITTDNPNDPHTNKTPNTNPNLLLDDNLFQAMPYLDSIPLISPINPNTRLYPPSTRNYFNIDLMLHQGSGNNHPENITILNMMEKSNQSNKGILLELSKFTPNGPNVTQNKEINLHNKILIHERSSTIMQLENSIQNNEGSCEVNESEEIFKEEIASLPQEMQVTKDCSEPPIMRIQKRPSPCLDLNLVNQTEGNAVNSDVSEQEESSKQNRNNNNTCDNNNDMSNSQSMRDQVKKVIKVTLTPAKASLNLSPKSAFVRIDMK